MGNREMNWVLFVVISAYTGPAVTNADFQTYEACSSVKNTLKLHMEEQYSNVKMYCFNKITGESK